MILLVNYKLSFWIGLIQLYFVLGFTNLIAQNTTPETTIQNGYLQDKNQGSQTKLEHVNRELDSVYKSQDNIFNRYWLSYGLYNQALIAGLQKKDQQAVTLVDCAIELLTPLKEDAESLALLSLEQGYSTQFKGYLAMIRIGGNAVLNAQRAVAINPNSLRANLAIAINDFYTPKAFGGGKIALEYLNKAMEGLTIYPEDSLPRWGKPNVYELLIKYHKKKEQDSIALEYLTQALNEFPDSQLLQGMK